MTTHDDSVKKMMAHQEIHLIGTKKRYPFITAVHWVAFNPAGEVLLLRRYQTGYMDGSYSLPAGHVDGEETAREAMVREIREEVGIDLPIDRLEFAHVMHRNQIIEPNERIDFFFLTKNVTDIVKNCEPHKCDQLCWVQLHNAPSNMVLYVKKALTHISRGECYSEYTE